LFFFSALTEKNRKTKQNKTKTSKQANKQNKQPTKQKRQIQDVGSKMEDFIMKTSLWRTAKMHHLCVKTVD